MEIGKWLAGVLVKHGVPATLAAALGAAVTAILLTLGGCAEYGVRLGADEVALVRQSGSSSQPKPGQALQGSPLSVTVNSQPTAAPPVSPNFDVPQK